MLLSLLLGCGIIFSSFPHVILAQEEQAEYVLEGEGTLENPYLVQSEEDLMQMASLVEKDEEKASASYRLTRDLSMEGYDFEGIGKTNPFTGIFDGNGFTIDDLHIVSQAKRVGLFSQLCGTVKNLTIGQNSVIEGNQYVGGIAGYSLQAEVLNCASYATVKAEVSDAGGLIGQMNSGSLLNSFARAKIETGKETAGGLAGYSGNLNAPSQPAVIRNCYSASEVSSQRYYASAVGYDDPAYPTTFENVYYDYDLCSSGPVGNHTTAAVQKKSTEWMQSYELVNALNELSVLETGWNTWVETDTYPEYGAIENELKDFMESIPDEPEIENGQIILPVSESGRYQTVLAGSDRKQVIDLDGYVYTPLVEQRVNLIYDIYDTQKERITTRLDRNVVKTVQGRYTDGGNACPNVVPSLQEWKGESGFFNLNENAAIIADMASADTAKQIAAMIDDMCGISLSVKTDTFGKAGDIILRQDGKLMSELGEEGYYLDIQDQVIITAADDAGLYYGGVSIAQILYQNKAAIPKGIARDYPAYEIRSGMIDVGRRFIPLDYVAEIVRYMSWFKMNEIHLHINENGGEYDSGFMIESKRYPQLNSNNGEYIWTQDEYRQFQKDARRYHMDVVTEIDSPGHATIFGKIDPDIVQGANFDLSNHYDESVSLMKSIYDEFLDGEDPVFQSAVFHIGTDESNNTNENMRRYINEMLTYVKAKDNIDEVRFWGNLSLYTGNTKVTNDATIQIWDAPDQRVDEALEAGYDVLNSTSCMLYIVPGAGAGPIFPDYWDPVKLYDMWGGASDFTTHALSDPYMIGNRNYYAEYDLLKGNPQIRGAEFCIWNDSAGGISDFDLFSRARSFIAVVAEKTWYGDEDAYVDGKAFMEKVEQIDQRAPSANPARYVPSATPKVAAYDFENTEGKIVYDTENQYDGTLHDAQIKAIGENHVLKLDGAGSMQLPFDSLGFPYTVEFDLYLDGEQEEDAALFSSDDCTIYLNYEDRGLGFVRGKYGFTFDMEIPQDQWIHIVMTSKAPHYPGVDDTIVLIGDSWYSATKISGPGSQKSTTSLIGTKEIGSKIRGMMDNLALYQAHIAEIDDLEAAHLDGTGTKDDPYLIASAQDLTAFSLLTSIRNYENEYFVLTDDIDMSEVKFTPAGQQPFAGTLDGQGHVIKHLTIDSSTSETGLFHAIEKGTVKNLGIDGGEIKGTGRVGAIAGRTMYAVIQNCFNTSDVIGTSDVGGLVGMYNNSYMGNCYNLGNITGSHDGASFGGLVGSSNRSLDPETSSVIENCYNLGVVNSEDGRYTGSLIGYLETQEEFMQTYRSLYYLQGEDPTGFGLFEGMEALNEEDFYHGTLLQLLNDGKKADQEDWVEAENGLPIFRYQQNKCVASQAAIQALQNMLDKANAIESKDDALNAAIASAQAVLDKEAPTTTEVVTALLDLSEAMQALNTDESEDALRKDVQATIDFIKENILTNVDNVRPGKVQALKDAVAAAQNVVDDPDATADELKAANRAMTKAAQELWEIVSKAELNALTEAANGYLNGDYTAESIEALKAAIESAQAVADNDDATTSEVTQAITNLSEAIANLDKITLDTSALEHEIGLVTEMIANLDNYVPSTVEGLADKLADAQNVLTNATSQEEIDEAAKSLREARLNARTKADVSALEELIAYVNSLDLHAYTSASVAAMNVPYTKALVMIENEEVTQEQVDELAEEMQAAIDALEPVNANATTPDAGSANDSSNSTTAESTNTAAATQTGMLFVLLAVAGAAGIAAYRKKRS